MASEANAGYVKPAALIVAVTLATPFLCLMVDGLTAYEQFQEQGWRFFIPTWEGLSELWSVGSFGAFLLGMVAFSDALDTYPDVILISAVMGVLGMGFVGAIFIARMEEWTGRKKVFGFAEVE